MHIGGRREPESPPAPDYPRARTQCAPRPKDRRPVPGFRTWLASPEHIRYCGTSTCARPDQSASRPRGRPRYAAQSSINRRRRALFFHRTCYTGRPSLLRKAPPKQEPPPKAGGHSHVIEGFAPTLKASVAVSRSSSLKDIFAAIWAVPCLERYESQGLAKIVRVGAALVCQGPENLTLPGKAHGFWGCLMGILFSVVAAALAD